MSGSKSFILKETMNLYGIFTVDCVVGSQYCPSDSDSTRTTIPETRSYNIRNNALHAIQPIFEKGHHTYRGPTRPTDGVDLTGAFEHGKQMKLKQAKRMLTL
ncbi:hypothetical protein GMOD_00004306 [Pyrenophora seminiperda CCB06]|uniref:Uncharacterized protein n=1 Tax=Pyrenophora seminiperda CCB06 TaxID=1302712 RepID=A0A3M7M0T7_9PLEO|nr:hypothetical protein GMOD_00004306 [Pyrenophora seminiperda CCB06]